MLLTLKSLREINLWSLLCQFHDLLKVHAWDRQASICSVSHPSPVSSDGKGTPASAAVRARLQEDSALRAKVAFGGDPRVSFFFFTFLKFPPKRLFNAPQGVDSLYRFSHRTHVADFAFDFASTFPVNVFQAESLYMLKHLNCDIRVRSGSLEHLCAAVQTSVWVR